MFVAANAVRPVHGTFEPVLGAQPAELLATLVRHGLVLAGIGTALGLMAAAGLTRLMSSLLFGVTALDPVTYLAVYALLVAAAV
jgi:ABC-type lipoprotein release transport system permease subunit